MRGALQLRRVQRRRGLLVVPRQAEHCRRAAQGQRPLLRHLGRRADVLGPHARAGLLRVQVPVVRVLRLHAAQLPRALERVRRADDCRRRRLPARLPRVGLPVERHVPRELRRPDRRVRQRHVPQVAHVRPGEHVRRVRGGRLAARDAGAADLQPLRRGAVDLPLRRHRRQERVHRREHHRPRGPRRVVRRARVHRLDGGLRRGHDGARRAAGGAVDQRRAGEECVHRAGRRRQRARLRPRDVHARRRGVCAAGVRVRRARRARLRAVQAASLCGRPARVSGASGRDALGAGRLLLVARQNSSRNHCASRVEPSIDHGPQP
mmetsp:Transcript_26800/g.66308  ORF Transcript_26800/g.66308 Transcript_26800/m.66308 type:complete len:321 (+) Transcript_26800:699-1661(+)